LSGTVVVAHSLSSSTCLSVPTVIISAVLQNTIYVFMIVQGPHWEVARGWSLQFVPSQTWPLTRRGCGSIGC
jgi:predicted alpha/beta hydrolase family esterase